MLVSSFSILIWRFQQKGMLSRGCDSQMKQIKVCYLFLIENSSIGENLQKLHVAAPPCLDGVSVAFALKVWDKSSKKACKGRAPWPFLFSANPHPPHLYEGQGTVHWKVALRPHPRSFCPLLLPQWPWNIARTSCILCDQYSRTASPSWSQ